MAYKSEGIGLARALESLHAELLEAYERAGREEVQFPIETATIELKVAVRQSAQGETKFRVALMGADVGKVERETLQTVTVVLGAPGNAHRYG